MNKQITICSNDTFIHSIFGNIGLIFLFLDKSIIQATALMSFHNETLKPLTVIV